MQYREDHVDNFKLDNNILAIYNKQIGLVRDCTAFVISDTAIFETQ